MHHTRSQWEMRKKTFYDVDKDVLVTHIIPNIQQPLLKKINRLEEVIKQSGITFCNMQPEYPYCEKQIFGQSTCTSSCRKNYCFDHIFTCEYCANRMCDKCKPHNKKHDRTPFNMNRLAFLLM